MLWTRLNSQQHDFRQCLDRFLDRWQEPDEAIVQQVSAILCAVRERGDEAVLEYTQRFDQYRPDDGELEIPSERMEAACGRLSAELRQSLEHAAERILDFHRRQKQSGWEFCDALGNTLGQRCTALDRVGVYVPGGKASYPSSVLMNVLPAVVAGVREIIMVSPAPDGQLNELVLAAANMAGVSRAFAIGGAQAVAALAWGTRRIPRVDKIVGPGNSYVAVAKRLVFGRVGIDMIAGPSELLIVADSSASPDWVAIDMFAQLEHDEQASAVVLSPDPALLDGVARQLDTRLPQMRREHIIRAALGNSALIQVSDLNEAAVIVNRFAPEHLELMLEDPDVVLPQIRHAGAIFMGSWSAEVLGDYCAGPSHVLPTGSTARFSSPLGVHDFQKHSSIIRCTASSASELARIAACLAREEGLEAHALSAELRTGKPDQ